MNPNRKSNGQYKREGNLARQSIIALIIIIGIVVIAMWYRNQYPLVITNTVTNDVSSKMYADKIDTLEKSVVASLHQCEKQNYTEADGLVTFDPTNAQYEKVKGLKHFVNKGELSFGTYQFKQSTVIGYYKTLYNQVITGKDALLIALDDEKAGQLTQDILFKTKNGYTNWINCTDSLSLVDMINAIKKIK